MKTPAEAQEAYETILENAGKYQESAQILGVQVQEMAPRGTEVIVGAVTDPSFGKLVAFGLGGILVEVLKDITFRLAPTGRDEALTGQLGELLDSLDRVDLGG